MPRPIDASLPRCAKHPNARVTRAGTYGARKRPLYRCWPQRAKDQHAFSPPSNEVRRQYRYSNSEIAHALWFLGRGVSFHEAGAEIRHRTGRRESKDSNLTVPWLERFAPAIIETLTPRPQTLGNVLLDAVPFNIVALHPDGTPKPGGELRFTVLGAAAQQRTGAPMTVLALRAYWDKSASSWRDFLQHVPGDATRIICDGEAAIRQTARVRWPSARLTASAWHLLHRCDEILTKNELDSRKGKLYPALRQSLSSKAAWERFVRLARAQKIADLEKWILEVEAVIEPQIARHERPTSTGALETALRSVKRHLAEQRGSYRNLDRLNLLLGLDVLRLNGVDDEKHYAQIIAGVT